MKRLWPFFFLSLSAQALTLEESRSRCEALTNPDVKEAEGRKLTEERKTAMLSFVRDTCEQQERAFDAGHFPDPVAWDKLDLIYHSFVDRHRVEAGVGLLDIFKMGLTHDLSPYLLKFTRTADDGLPAESDAFWKSPAAPLHEAFERQWKAAGVDPGFSWLRLDKLEGKGSVAKVHADDLRNGERWLIKWGDEIHSDPVASRIFASLGFNVDFPFHRGAGELRLLLGRQGKQKRTVRQLVNFIYNSYKINLSPFIRQVRVVTDEMIRVEPLLRGREGETYLTFTGLALEPRPSSETRLGPFMPDLAQNRTKRSVRGALLAEIWIGNWDTKTDNTLLALTPEGLKASYSDLGVSLGVRIGKFPRDLKGGLVNELGWDVLTDDGQELRFLARMNHIPEAWRETTWSDLAWMAKQIARIGPDDLRAMLSHSGWPQEVRELYFHKLAERRRQILKAFQVSDPHAWQINRQLSIGAVVKNGELVREPDLTLYPAGLWHTRGRFRGYGW
jgi:hypothetical protein